MSGFRQGGLKHTPECRERIETAIMNDPVDRERITTKFLEKYENKKESEKDPDTHTHSRGPGPNGKQSIDTGVSSASASSAGTGVPSTHTDETRQATGSASQFSAPASPRSVGLKRSAPEEGDEEMTELHELFDPDEEINEFLMNLHDKYVATVQEQVQNGLQNPVCEARDPLNTFDPESWMA